MITNALVQARQLYEDTDGVLVCDKYGYVEYLKWFHEGFLSDEAIGMHVTEVYPELDNQTSSIMRVIESGVPRFDERQVIHNCKGELLDIVSSTIPLLAGSEVVGAMTSTIFYDKYRAGKGLPKRRQGELYTLDDIISQDPIMIALKERCALIANNDSPVLLYGETGTGKELFAQSIHNASDRRDGPFVAINCAAVSNSLLESELFGYEAGSFTGASRGGREGVFELAHGGTLFLDEIGEIPRETQVELLRVLQEKEIRRVGGSRVIPVDVRIIAATNKDLLQETVEGRFREDLYYRLDVLDLKLPPLRERGDDVKILGLHLFRQLPGGKDPIMQSQFLYLLEQAGPYQWYGNIRELQNFVERANILMRNAGASSVTVSDILRRRAEPAPEPCQETESRDRRAIEAALHNHPGSMADAARSLGCSRQTLWRKMKKYGIQR